MESGDYGAGGDSGFREHRGVTESDEYFVAVCLGLIAGFPMGASHPEYPSLSVIACTISYRISSSGSWSDAGTYRDTFASLLRAHRVYSVLPFLAITSPQESP